MFWLIFELVLGVIWLIAGVLAANVYYFALHEARLFPSRVLLTLGCVVAAILGPISLAVAWWYARLYNQAVEEILNVE